MALKRMECCHGNFVISHVKLKERWNFAPKLRSNSSPMIIIMALKQQYSLRFKWNYRANGTVFICLFNFYLLYLQCSVTCGSGEKKRTVECSDKSSSCDARTKPETTASCNLKACPQWKTSQWGEVSYLLFSTLYTLNEHENNCT